MRVSTQGVKTMAYKESQNKTATKSVVNTNVIINRPLPLLSSGDIDLPAVFATELSEVVTSLFQANGDIRLASSHRVQTSPNSCNNLPVSGHTERFSKQTTLFQKKLHPFYFCNNFVGPRPILIIFGRTVANEFYNLLTLTYLLLYFTTENQLKFC